MKSTLSICIAAAICSVTASGQVQMGSDLVGINIGDRFGNALALSGDGQRVIVGARGYTQVFDFVPLNGWQLVGMDIVPPIVDGYAANVVDIANEGQTVLIANKRESQEFEQCGAVRVYDWDGETWQQRGETIFGEDDNEFYGADAVLSDDGSTVIASANWFGWSDNLNMIGQVRRHTWNGNEWAPQNGSINGGNGVQHFGTQLDLSSAGTRLVAGGVGSGNGAIIRTYDWSGANWNTSSEELSISDQIYSDASGLCLSLSGDGQRLVAATTARTNTYGWSENGWELLDSWNERAWDVSLSGDGMTLAHSDASGANQMGELRVMIWANGHWDEAGYHVGDAIEYHMGDAVAISSMGNVYAGGATGEFGFGNETIPGYVEVYESQADNVMGCTDPQACNFSAAATEDDGTCDYLCTGCTDPLAMNYDPDANVDDGSCTFFEPSCAAIGDTAVNTWDLLETGFYPDTLYATHGVTNWSWPNPLETVFHLSETITDDNGGVYQVIGFTVNSITPETTGISWNSTALSNLIDANEQWCLQGWGTPQAVGIYEVTMSGTLILDIFGEPTPLDMQSFSFHLVVADNPEEVLGCTYTEAHNFNTYANADDGSCVFSGCIDTLAINFDSEATVLDNSCLYAGCTDEGALNYGGTPNEYYTIEEIDHALPYPLNFGQAFEQVNDDWYSDPISLGWEFTLFGAAYNTLQVSSNGYLFFGESDFGYSPWQIENMQLPNDFLPYPAIFAAYHDMNPTECGEIFFGIDGEAPNRSFVVSWNEVCPFSSSCQDALPSSVQVILREGTHEIEFHVVNRSSCSGWNEDALIVGMQAEQAAWASTPAGFNNETPVVSERSWIAYPQTSPGPTYDDGSCLYAGCMDAAACNYLAEAIEDNGSCVYAADACGVGTEWDEDTQSCLPIEGFCQTDLDGDGLVAVSDLLLILADFGYECPE